MRQANLDQDRWTVQRCQHIKKLADADEAYQILMALKRAADPILRARRWTVLLLYEVSCPSISTMPAPVS
eukprot:6186021-Pleurochrysis_carterae.AAC.2